MKGDSSTTIIAIIIAVIIGVFILYLAWSRGMLPFSVAVSESQCKAYLTSQCQRAAEVGWDPSVFSQSLLGCKQYVSDSGLLEDCLQNKNKVSCEKMCEEFISR